LVCLPNPWGKQIFLLVLAYAIHRGCRRVTFICGQTGVCALGALAAKHAGDRRLLYHYLAQSKRRLLHLFPIYAFFYQKLVALINVN
jgi:hypothetical protein